MISKIKSFAHSSNKIYRMQRLKSLEKFKMRTFWDTIPNHHQYSQNKGPKQSIYRFQADFMLLCQKPQRFCCLIRYEKLKSASRQKLKRKRVRNRNTEHRCLTKWAENTSEQD